MQLQIYKECYSKVSIPCISFDATGGCCKRIKRPEGNQSNHLFLYEGIMNIDSKTFTVLSMISEQHDTLSIYIWSTRWLRCGIKAPKMVISDQSLAIMPALVQSFTQYKSLQEYLEVCFKFAVNKNENKNKIPSCYIRNDINHFFSLIAKWNPLKQCKFTRTKQLFIRSMTLLIYCTSMKEAKKIL